MMHWSLRKIKKLCQR